MSDQSNKYTLADLENKVKFKHNVLLIHVADNITTPQLQKMKRLSQGIYLGAGILEKCDALGLLNALEEKGRIRVGHYEVLKKLLKYAGVEILVEYVEKAGNDIMKLKEIVFDDDPSHVKALKEYYEKICSALQKGSTLADVTKTLKRHKILDDQHQIGDPGPESVRELLNTVMNKRNKGLRAMRFLACALRDTGHRVLAGDILTTQYSWERGAGCNVLIPFSEWRIISAYLDITEKLTEPDFYLVLDHLVSKGKVSEEERTTILQQPSRVEKVQEMLDTVLSGDREEAGRVLMDALRHVGHFYLAFRMKNFDLRWEMLDLQLSKRYMVKQCASLHNSYTCLAGRREQLLLTADERITSWMASDSDHGELMKTTICGQWALSSDEPGQREWRGHKAVIDVETVEEVLGDHARKRNQSVQETLASMPDFPENSLFILNAMKRPDLKTKWKSLLSGEMFPDAKVILIEGSDGKIVPKRNVKQGCNLAKLLWSLLENILSECYRDKLRNISISDGLADLVSRKRRMSTRSQLTTLPRMRPEERVVSWEVIDSEHGELVKIVICWLWANSSDEPGQRNWGGHKAVIDLEILDAILGESNDTVLKVLDVIPDETLFILNTMAHPDLKTKWSLLLSGKLLPDAKVLLIKDNGGKGMSHSGESTENCSAKKQRNTTLETKTEATGVDISKCKQCTVS